MGGSDTRLGEEVEHVPALLAKGQSHGEDSLDESTALLAVCSEAPLPIKHGRPDRSLRCVVGGLDPLDADEGPERRSHLEDHFAHAFGLGFAAASPFPKKRFDRLPNRTHVDLETGSGESSISDTSPKREHLLRLAKEFGADPSCLGPTLDEALEIPDQVAPTDLATTDSPTVVAIPAIRGEVASECSQKGPSRIRPAVDMDQEHADPRRDSGPQPGPLASLPPSRLVGVDAGLGLHKVSGRFDRRRQGLADRLLRGGDRAGGYADIKEVFERLASRALGQSQFPGEVGNHGLKGGPLHPRGDSPRQLRHRPMGALRADQAMKQILDDLGVDRWNFSNLVPKRRRILSCEAVSAVLTLLRLEGDDVVDLLDRHELVRGALMTRLTSRRPPRGRFGATRRSRRRITGRRTRGVSGVLVEAGFQLEDSLILLGGPPFKGGKLGREGFQFSPERGNDLPAGSMNVAFGFPRLHLLMKPEGTEIDSSELKKVYELSGSARATVGHLLTP